MLELILYLALTGLLLSIGYIVTVFSKIVLLDAREIADTFPDLSPRKKKQLERLTSHPRTLIQVAFAIRLTSALALGILSLAIAQRLTELLFVPSPAAYTVLFLVVWTITLILFLYFPRQVFSYQSHSSIIHFLPLITFLYCLSAPVVVPLGRFFGKKNQVSSSTDQRGEIVERAIETLAESAGVAGPIIEEDEKEMIHQIFRLDITEAEEIMIPRVNIIALEKTASLPVIRDTIRQFGYSRYPVYDGTIDHIIGIAAVKDLLLLTKEQIDNFQLTAHVRKPLRVGEHKKIDQLLAEFKKTRTHMAIVVDEFGGTAGLVTMEDILEEIVGDIQDEYDPGSTPEIVRLSNGQLEVTGNCPLKDLSEAINLDSMPEEFETVGGLVYDLVGSIPVEGAILTWQNHILKVISVEGQRIRKILVIPPSTE